MGHNVFDWNFVAGFIRIVLIDLLLAGDNAFVIAMAVRCLPKGQRIKGMIFGAGGAVILRIIITFFAFQLLQIQFVKFIGGILVLWIGIKLQTEGAPDEDNYREVKNLWHAIWIIMIADISMSLDNVLAVAGACDGNMFLFIFGLALSIPLVLFTSNILSILMDKYPTVIYAGAAILGWVGGRMIITDPFIAIAIHPVPWLIIGIQLFCAIGVVMAGRTLAIKSDI